ncbi:hypothetical protein RugamoR1_54790 [Rugamonas sp. R1(2021)]
MAKQVTEGLSLASLMILATGCDAVLEQKACRVFAPRGALMLGTARTKDEVTAACATFPASGL